MGFDIECIVNVESLPDDYFCPVCGSLVCPMEALQAQCGHLYCKPCLDYIVATDQACPDDGGRVTEANSKPLTELNKELAETIGKVAAQCIYHKRGCQWQGTMDDCLTHCAECNFRDSPVVHNCGRTQVIHRQVGDHSQHCPDMQPQEQLIENSKSKAPPAPSQAVAQNLSSGASAAAPPTAAVTVITATAASSSAAVTTAADTSVPAFVTAADTSVPAFVTPVTATAPGQAQVQRQLQQLMENAKSKAPPAPSQAVVQNLSSGAPAAAPPTPAVTLTTATAASSLAAVTTAADTSVPTFVTSVTATALGQAQVHRQLQQLIENAKSKVPPAPSQAVAQNLSSGASAAAPPTPAVTLTTATAASSSAAVTTAADTSVPAFVTSVTATAPGQVQVQGNAVSYSQAPTAEQSYQQWQQQYWEHCQQYFGYVACLQLHQLYGQYQNTQQAHLQYMQPYTLAAAWQLPQQPHSPARSPLGQYQPQPYIQYQPQAPPQTHTEPLPQKPPQQPHPQAHIPPGQHQHWPSMQYQPQAPPQTFTQPLLQQPPQQPHSQAQISPGQHQPWPCMQYQPQAPPQTCTQPLLQQPPQQPHSQALISPGQHQPWPCMQYQPQAPPQTHTPSLPQRPSQAKIPPGQHQPWFYMQYQPQVAPQIHTQPLPQQCPQQPHLQMQAQLHVPAQLPQQKIPPVETFLSNQPSHAVFGYQYPQPIPGTSHQRTMLMHPHEVGMPLPPQHPEHPQTQGQYPPQQHPQTQGRYPPQQHPQTQGQYPPQQHPQTQDQYPPQQHPQTQVQYPPQQPPHITTRVYEQPPMEPSQGSTTNLHLGQQEVQRSTHQPGMQTHASQHHFAHPQVQGHLHSGQMQQEPLPSTQQMHPQQSLRPQGPIHVHRVPGQPFPQALVAYQAQASPMVPTQGMPQQPFQHPPDDVTKPMQTGQAPNQTYPGRSNPCMPTSSELQRSQVSLSGSQGTMVPEPHRSIEHALSESIEHTLYGKPNALKTNDITNKVRAAYLDEGPRFDGFMPLSRPSDNAAPHLSIGDNMTSSKPLPSYQSGTPFPPSSAGSFVHLDIGERERSGMIPEHMGKKHDAAVANKHNPPPEFGHHCSDALRSLRSPGREYGGFSSRKFCCGGQSLRQDFEERDRHGFGPRFKRSSTPLLAPGYFKKDFPDGPASLRSDIVGSGILPGQMRRGLNGPDIPNILSRDGGDQGSVVSSNIRGNEAAGFGGFHSQPGISEQGSSGNLHSNICFGGPGFNVPFNSGDVDSIEQSRKRKPGSMGWCRLCKFDCDTVEGLDLHSQTREHQKMAMDLAVRIEQDNTKRHKLTSDNAMPFLRCKKF